MKVKEASNMMFRFWG